MRAVRDVARRAGARRGQAIRRLVVLAALAALTAACGIPLDSGPRSLSLSELPVEILQHGTTTTTPGSPVTPHEAHFNVYFLDSKSGLLVPELRYSQTTISAQDALDYLTLGPTALEAARSVTTALSENPQSSLRVTLSAPSGLATVSLDATFELIFGVQLYEAFAQIVYTLTSLPRAGITKVTFLLAGSVYNYLPNGTFVARPVDQADYRALAPA